ncbi:unnamed protein product, partial [marine sediment metagenome]
PALERQPIYEGIGISILYDVSLVSDDELKILSWGLYHDDEMAKAMGEAEFQGFKTDIFKAVADQGDYQAAWELAAGDKDALDDMNVDVLKGYPIVAPVALAEGGFAAASTGIAASAVTKGLQVASSITKVIPTVLRSSLYRKIGATGAVVTAGAAIGGVWDKYFNADEYDMLGEDDLAQSLNNRTALAEADDRLTRDASESTQGSPSSGQPVAAGWQAPEDPGPRTFDRPAAEGQTGPPSDASTGVVDPSPGGAYDPNAPIPTGKDLDPFLDDPFVGGIPQGYE